MNYFKNIIKSIAKRNPNLKVKLNQAGIIYSAEEFIQQTLLSAFYMALGISVFIITMLSKLELVAVSVYMVCILFLLIYFIIFSYLMKVPDVKIAKKGKEVNKEIIFAGRFLIIELESGISLYNAMVNVSKNYKIVGGYFNEIIDKVSLGTRMEDAINETIEKNPSSNLNKVLWQVLNSLKTGADISQSLSGILRQISREQLIEVKEYGRKLNPLAMFFMVIAIIMPSLGITMLIIFTTFISLTIDLTALMAIALFIGFIQYMFFSMIKSSRPAVEI